MAITRKELAKALGISAPSVTKMAKRGMPTDTVERVRRWRDRHLDPGRTVDGRADYRQKRGPGAPQAIDHEVELPHRELAAVAALGRAAASALDAGSMKVLEPHLRAALRAVPHWARQSHVRIERDAESVVPESEPCEPMPDGAVTVPERVWLTLVDAFVLAVREVEVEAAAGATAWEEPDLADFDLAEILYQVAAGEVVITPHGSGAA